MPWLVAPAPHCVPFALSFLLITVYHSGENGILRQAGLVDRVVALVVGREAALDEDLVGRRRRELRPSRSCRSASSRRCRPRRIEAGGHRRAAVLQQAVVVDGELVLRAHLPGDARLHALDALRIDALRRCSAARRDVGVSVPAMPLNVLAGSVSSAKSRTEREEPDLVLLDRTADRAFDVVQLVDAVAGLQAAVDQILRDVVALEALLLVAEEQAAADACCRRRAESCSGERRRRPRRPTRRRSCRPFPGSSSC